MSAFYARGTLTKRRLGVLGALTATVSALAVMTGPAAQASPPTPVDAATARTYLSELTVAAEGSLDGYDRDQFPHWITQDGSCDTRETVLKRDGENVETDSDCSASSGSWFSEYDGETWTASGDVDIDHVVPLAEAWRSGANGWTTPERQGFANDLSQPQLIAVTDNVNQSKGDKDPSEWMPPSSSYNCTYVRMWVQVKHHYDLTIDDAEKSALESTLSGC
ncbi:MULTISPECIES: HNH endonuclease family protein [Streptomyces]|uniref:S-layer domain-containing protein n=1 Tax=Streptomyces albus (strain ATCC 21838 / DSM 41398 / FERM P-419 / JCM 4703 / NBRC 107858) TaxID=1081613 RepID=A0A0B5F2R3_STRA4|nr:HNH endonuclease family protein [Streptomyces sp. SCSIO ZS0520]AJE85855.1 S-layer domain-containing protein [Streptomyces albus]AOU80159.1 S-layer domain-containing protein [Streptomyces albus]AYN35875.1 HNH endonuclease [Streptomyces albus]